ncbi:GNAT family N-acetyltransferase [Altererythrobacter sp. KTW20L]|uniref:GNAT family N-acetyltransferase n=1 Tax=Altererythrobacter sp. KTW20L TaxID=2942210 RepID=UPI0020BD5406|nr:GNAT family N-acetyltransferase [Altererythrobacter sp. KTW20L]MCL6249932.1 GNAT family N-acetyltransferase [Altererythrobacter sp. KTW20L]
MAEAVLQTARLDLRCPQASDAGEMQDTGAVFTVLNTPTVMEHLAGVITRAQIDERLARSAATFAAEGFCFLLMFERDGGALVGHCGLKRVDDIHAPNPGDLEIGWLVREDRWRRGYAREAVDAVLRWAFEDHGAEFVVAQASNRNVASWSLMEAVGMTRAPALEFHDPDYPPIDNPTIVYQITREEWATR